jgi:hypothetical protein
MCGHLSEEYPEYLSGYEAGNYWNPLFIEISKDGESVRLYRNITPIEEAC